MKSLYLLIILSLLGLGSCQKATDVVDKKYGDGGRSHIAYSVNPANSNNQYDSTGIIHNNGLDYIIERKENFTCDTNRSKIVLDSLVCVYRTSILSTVPSYINADDPSGYQNTMWITTRFLGGAGTMDYYNISSVIQDAVFDIKDIIDLSCSSYSTQQVVDSIKSYETSIINNINLTTLQKKKILSVASVMRYSFVYWTDVAADSSNDWHGHWLNCDYLLSPNNNNVKHSKILETDCSKIGKTALADGIALASSGLNPLAAVTASAACAAYLWFDSILSFFGII